MRLIGVNHNALPVSNKTLRKATHYLYLLSYQTVMMADRYEQNDNIPAERDFGKEGEFLNV